MKSRRYAVFLFVCMCLLTIIAFRIFGPAVWKFWNIPTLQPPFADAHIVTASAESFRLGFDPEIENPRDPFGRRFNLPAPWKLFFFTSIDQSHTFLFAGFLIASFIFGTLTLIASVDPSSGWLIVLCAFSPPVMLAVERGNVDLFLFFICAVLLSLIERPAVYASALLLIAGVLKLYPVFGMGALMKYGKSAFLKFSAALTLALFLLLSIDVQNLRNVFANTEKGYDISYGVDVLPSYLALATRSESLGQVAAFFSMLAVFLILILGFVRATQSVRYLHGSNAHALAAFRLGAGIYVGTFLLGNNWDYRLMFLLFTLPQLLEWINVGKVARYALFGVLISLSYFWIARLLPLAYFIDEFANWLTFGGLFYLLVASAPDWLRSEFETAVIRFKRRSIRA